MTILVRQGKIGIPNKTQFAFPNNIHAHIFVSWLHPFKEHRLIVIGSRGMMVFEDNLTQDKLKFYPKGFQDKDGRIEKFDSAYEIIAYDDAPPLANEQKHFFQAVVGNTKPLTDGEHALEVLTILEKAQGKLRKYGAN